MPIPDVPWGGRDTTALAHELIHRWVHDGADPAAIDAARARHAARGEDLRVAARALERAQSDLGGAWRGRNAAAAGAHLRSLAARMTGLGDAVSGQATSLGAMRDALTRVQAAVRSPRPPVFGPLRVPPAAAGLPEAVLGGPRDGFGLFQAAQAEERAAQTAYQAYLRETSTAARGAPPALEVATGRAPSPAGPIGPAVPERAATARPGAPRGAAGALARAAAAESAAAAHGSGGVAASGAGGAAPGAARPGGAVPGIPAARGSSTPPSTPSGGTGRGVVPRSPAGPTGTAVPPEAGPSPGGGPLGRVWQRILGPETGGAGPSGGVPGRAAAGSASPGPSPGALSGPGSTSASGGVSGATGAGGAAARGAARGRTRRADAGSATPSTAADRVASGVAQGHEDVAGRSGPDTSGHPGGTRAGEPGVPEPRGADHAESHQHAAGDHDPREYHDREPDDRAPDDAAGDAATPVAGPVAARESAGDGSWPAATPPGAQTGLVAASAADAPGGPGVGSGTGYGAALHPGVLHPGAPGTGVGGLGGVGPLPGAGLAGAAGTRGAEPAARKRPDYLVEADPWDDGDEARLVTPPVLGSEEPDR